MSTPTRSTAARGIEGTPTGRTDATPTEGNEATHPRGIDAVATALLAGGSR